MRGNQSGEAPAVPRAKCSKGRQGVCQGPGEGGGNAECQGALRWLTLLKLGTPGMEFRGKAECFTFN